MAKTKREMMITSGPVEIRSNDNGTKQIVGQAIVFNSESRAIYGEFVEVIAPQALDEANMERVVARGDHDNANLLGTTMGGTLQLEVKSDGLYYVVDVPDTEVGRSYAYHIERGDIQDSSFAFTINWREEGAVKWVDRSEEGKLPLREIRNIDAIYDVSPVLTGAYPAASAGMRADEDPRMAELRNIQEEWAKPALEDQEKLRAESESMMLIHKHKTLKR